MIPLAAAAMGAQVLFAIAAWFAAPVALAAWALGLAWLAGWSWSVFGGAAERLAGGPWRRAAAVSIALLPLLGGAGWCLGGWWGWWPELEIAAVIVQGLLMPAAPLLDCLPQAAPEPVAPYLWTGAALPWGVLPVAAAWAWRRHRLLAARTGPL